MISMFRVATLPCMNTWYDWKEQVVTEEVWWVMAQFVPWIVSSFQQHWKDSVTSGKSQSPGRKPLLNMSDLSLQVSLHHKMSRYYDKNSHMGSLENFTQSATPSRNATWSSVMQERTQTSFLCRNAGEFSGYSCLHSRFSIPIENEAENQITTTNCWVRGKVMYAELTDSLFDHCIFTK